LIWVKSVCGSAGAARTAHHVGLGSSLTFQCPATKSRWLALLLIGVLASWDFPRFDLFKDLFKPAARR